ncbi:MAG: hydrogenase 4 subunit B [Thiohalomonadaceae bacterium]
MTIQWIACAVLLSLLSGGVGLGASYYRALLRWACFPLLGLSGLATVIAGFLALLGDPVSTQLPLGLPWLSWSIYVDALAGFFLILIGVVVFAVAVFGPGYTREFQHGRHSLAALCVPTGLFVAGMQLVVIANDAFMFMIAWELMSLSSYFLVAYQHEQAANRRAAFLYLLMAHIGGIAILLSYGVLAAFSDGFSFELLRAAELPTLWASIAFALAFFGFGMKAGLVPLHAWLPEAHPVAPSHISALMSGVMLKVAVYGFIRVVFDLIGQMQVDWGVIVLLTGSASALLGVLYAMQQTDIKRLLAYSSIENIGVIFMALGFAMIFLAAGYPKLGTLGLIAALYHALNHALFKGLLFLSAGAIIQQTHQQSLEHMGGLLKRLPYTGTFFLIGCLSIATLPPFNGFASEWLILQTALQGVVLENGLLRIVIPVTAAVLALTTALAAMLFVRLYGISFLGQPRTRQARQAHLPSFGMRSAQGMLAALCILLGILPAVAIKIMGAIPQTLRGLTAPEITGQGWLWLTPASAASASYSAPLVLLGLALVWWLSYFLLHGRKHQQVQRVPAWDCGFGPLSARMQYTATAFAMPIRRIFKPVWLIDEKIERSGDEQGFHTSGLRHQLQVSDRSWKWLYLPIGRWVLRSARLVSRLQSGNVRTYLSYSFFTLLFLLWLIS